MAKVKVNCTKDLSGVFQNLTAGSNYILSFDGKDSYVEEITSTGTTVFVDGALTDVTPAAGNIVVIDEDGAKEITPIVDGVIDMATTSNVTTVSGIITAATAP